MPSTIKIPKSKALNFRKISFLYLIFFTMYFLSSTGEFIEQFVPMERTQIALNSVLEKQFQNIVPSFPKDQNLKQKAEKALKSLHELEIHIEQNLGKVKGEKLKSQQFLKRELNKNTDLYNQIAANLTDFIRCFTPDKQSAICKETGLDYEKFLRNETNIPQFFSELPNGAVGAVVQQLINSVLTNSLNFFKVETEFGKMVRIESASDSSFLQGYKENYFVGEQIEFDFFSKDSIAPEISINRVNFQPKAKGRHFIVSWLPTKAGTYLLSARLGSEFLNFPLKVTKPTLRFLEEDQELAAYLSEPLELTLDLQGMENIKGLRFESKGAKVVQRGEKLIVTPHFEGRFLLEMYADNLLLDTRSLDAIKGSNPKVGLRDIAGQNAPLGNAHCLESLSPYWQVLDFNLTICMPNGEKKNLKSQTRFLRSEVRKAELSAPKGSTLLFHNIRLLNVNGKSTIQGSPVFYIK